MPMKTNVNYLLVCYEYWHLHDLDLVDAELYLQNYDRLLWKHDEYVFTHETER